MCDELFFLGKPGPVDGMTYPNLFLSSFRAAKNAPTIHPLAELAARNYQPSSLEGREGIRGREDNTGEGEEGKFQAIPTFKTGGRRFDPPKQRPFSFERTIAW